MEPWTHKKDKPLPTVKNILSIPSTNLHEEDKYWSFNGNLQPFIKCFKILITGKSPMKEESSPPFLCSACIVKLVDFVFLKGFKSDFLFKNTCGPPKICWPYREKSNIPQEAKMLFIQVKLRDLLNIFYRFISFIPLFEVIYRQQCLFRTSSLFYLSYLNFSCSYRRASSSV